MTPLPAFTIDSTVNIYDIVGDLLDGELRQRPLSGAVVQFTNNLTETEFVTWEGELNRVHRTVTARVSSDGTILRNGAPVQLLANDAGLNVDGIQWQVSIQPRNSVPMEPWTFDAPNDGDTLDLTTTARVPFTTAVGITRGPKGDTGATGPTGPTASWSTITGKPTYVAEGSTQALARAAIGAGTASTKSDVGLGSVDNTADTAKPVSTAQAAADAAVLSSATTADATVLTTATGRAIAFAIALA